jgi:hypothetical protein
MKRLTFILLLLAATFNTFAQAPYSDCHVVYKDIPNFHYYGRQVQQRTDAANLDTLTCVYDGTFAFDTLSRTFKGYDGAGFHSIAFGEVRDTVIDLSSAEILALNGTPKTVVAAAGSGKLLQVLNATVKYTFVSTAYTGGTRFRIGTSTGQDFFSCDVLDATVSSIRTFHPPDHSTSPAGYSGGAENTDIEIDTVSVASTGDGTAKVWVRYQIIQF